MPVVGSPVQAQCGRPHFAPMCNGVHVCGRNRTEVRECDWAEGTVSSLPRMLNVRIKFRHSTGIVQSGGGVRASTTSYITEDSDPETLPKETFKLGNFLVFIKLRYATFLMHKFC